MITQRFYLYERLITELYDNTVDKINEMNKLDDLEKIYNAFCFTSDSYLNVFEYTLRRKRRVELINLIHSNHKKIRTLFLEKVKVVNNVNSRRTTKF